MKKIWFPLLLFTVLMIGCTSNQTNDSDASENVDMTKLSTTESSVNQDASNRAKDLLKKYDEITSLEIVNTKKKLVAGVSVHQKNRFHLKSLRKKWKKRIKEAFPNKKIEVTTDQKIIWELSDLEKKLQADNVTKKKLEKEIKRIIRLMKDNA